MVHHPEVAARSCSDCIKYWYDDKWDADTKKMVWSTSIVGHRFGKKFERPVDPQTKERTKPPCKDCPKKSPEEAKDFELTVRNTMALNFYLRVKATGGAILNDAMKEDETLMENLVAISQVLRG